VIAAALRLRGEAPVDVDYRTWVAGRAGDRAVEAAIGFVSLPTFHHDPGELSAAFFMSGSGGFILHGQKVRYVVRGWSVLVDALAQRARDVEVEIHTGSLVSDLPRAPVILALPLSAGGRLLPGRQLHASGTRTVLLDIALRSVGRSPRVVFDLTDRLYLTRVTGPDPSLAPAGEDLIQASAGLRPSESLEEATLRIEARWMPGSPAGVNARPGDGEASPRLQWRNRPTGHTWRDHPAVDQGDGVYLAGDAVAAPVCSQRSPTTALYTRHNSPPADRERLCRPRPADCAPRRRCCASPTP